MGQNTFSQVTLGNFFSFIFDGEPITGPAEEVGRSLVGAMEGADSQTVEIYLFLGTSNAGKSYLCQNLYREATTVGFQRVELAEWKLGGGVVPLEAYEELVTVKTSVNDTSSRSASLCTLRDHVGRLLILLDLPGDEPSDAHVEGKSDNTHARILAMLGEVRALLRERFPPMQVKGQWQYNQPMEAITKNLRKLLDNYMVREEPHGELGVVREFVGGQQKGLANVPPISEGLGMLVVQGAGLTYGFGVKWFHVCVESGKLRHTQPQLRPATDIQSQTHPTSQPSVTGKSNKNPTTNSKGKGKEKKGNTLFHPITAGWDTGPVAVVVGTTAYRTLTSFPPIRCTRSNSEGSLSTRKQN
ncbi:hypothetical protein BGX38DRAFT_1261332 [Terfezia claveryi]|nr:hypothetical protein BGX38DRAFT_1261332 [Terfezia claveryi]